jgi:N-methylhydantoinase A
MRLNAEAAIGAVTRVGNELGVSPLAAARGIFRVVCEAMAGAIKAHASDRGVDYRGIPLLAFGGAGPVHACEVAELLNSRTVIFPPHGSVFSALGALVTPTRLDLVRSSLSRLNALDWNEVSERFQEMEHEGRRALAEAGCAEGDIAFQYAADMRYVGQHYDIMVELGGRPVHKDGAQVLRSCFEAEYEKRYRIVQSEVEVEVVNWRLLWHPILAVVARRLGAAHASGRSICGKTTNLSQQCRALSCARMPISSGRSSSRKPRPL